MFSVKRIVVLGSRDCDACKRAEDAIGRILRGRDIPVEVVSREEASSLDNPGMFTVNDDEVWLPTICRADGGSLEECIHGYSEEEFERQLNNLIDNGGV